MAKVFGNLKSKLRIDKVFLILIIILVIVGILTFLSAALGILPNNELKFFSVIKTQVFYVFIFGFLALFIGTKIDYKYYKKYSIILFVLALLFTLTVFIPGLGFYYNGAHRWIDIFGLSFQPSEILKFASVVLIAAYCSKYSKQFKNIKIGFLPFLIFVILIGTVLLLQPDFGTFLVVLVPAFIVYFVGGAKMGDVFILIISGILLFLLLIQARPYMKERVLTFIEPNRESLGAGYHLNQSLIAIGSGGMFGRGVGQSIQKFNYLPEQISDSIFAVYAEELGFVGSVLFLALFFIIIMRGIFIARRVNDSFGKLLIIGIISTFFFQMSLNLGSAIGLAPLTGVPLPLVSKGGTSLIFLMFELGVLLNISRQKVSI
ncbi:putative peptidoglycan glycosyltransferase FtsW [bioreactor metagenome]|uniref:peptidoglycan glycosyltransferase n=1 Tax=bioreactor metagenome TaxID=1076179 RepID=A0A644T5P2_9ZZZZ|nr:FtsW/RodA/SpoVE family cell cycle protein [Candidatus Elulimicrobiales bacterium]